MKPRAYIITLLIILVFVVSKVSVTSYLYFKTKRAHKCEDLVAMGWDKAQDLYKDNPKKYKWADRDDDGKACDKYE